MLIRICVAKGENIEKTTLKQDSNVLVEVTIGTDVRRTNAIKDSNPEFVETFFYETSESQLKQTIYFNVLHDGLGGKDRRGETKINGIEYLDKNRVHDFKLPLQLTETGILYVKIYIEENRTLKPVRYTIKKEKTRLSRSNVGNVIKIKDYLDQELYCGNLYISEKDVSLYDIKTMQEVLTKCFVNGSYRMESKKSWFGRLEVKSLTDMTYRRLDVPDLLKTTGNKESIEVFSDFKMIGQVVKLMRDNVIVTVYDESLLLSLMMIAIEYMELNT